MSELRVAFAMGGGVSLGSFCGGALGEAVKQLLENRSEEYESVRFDVFSGASAGAMSLGLLVHTLAHPGFHGRAENVLERQRDAWVRRIDIQDLIPDPKMTRVNSILDRGAVDRTAQALLAWEEGTAPSTDCLGRRVLLACTLANLNGIPVDGRRAGQGDTFLDALQTTLYEDLRVFDLRLDPEEDAQARSTWLLRDDLARPEVWKEIAATCVAAGAFPVAFEPVALKRRREEYGSVWPAEWNDIESFPFTFSDGGMFDNEPLGEVMNLIGWMDAEPGDFERVVIFIDPNLSGTAEDLSLDYYRELEVRDPDNTLWKLGRLFDGLDVERRPYVDRMTGLIAPLVGALRGQAAFKDWLAAEKVNNRLEWRNQLRAVLGELLDLLPDDALEDGSPATRPSGANRGGTRRGQGGSEEGEPESEGSEAGAGEGFAAEIRDRLRGVLEEKGGRSIRGNPDLAIAREEARIEREEGERLRSLPPGKRKAYVHLLSLVDQVAGLRGRQQVQVVGIGPVDAQGEPLELAGNFIANFGGFFKEEYRSYDFDVGRERAGKLLGGAGLLKDRRRVPRPPPEPDVDPTPGTTPESERLLSRLKTVAGHFLDVRMDWPLKLDKLAVRLAQGRLGRMIGGALSGEGEAIRQYVVRLEIAPADPGDRFKLQGQHGGDSLEAEDVGARPVLETLLFYAPATGRVSGPHVTEIEGRPVVELVHDIRFQPDENRFLALPGASEIETLERLGYGKLVGRADWRELERAEDDEVVDLDAWEAEEALEEWEERAERG